MEQELDRQMTPLIGVLPGKGCGPELTGHALAMLEAAGGDRFVDDVRKEFGLTVLGTQEWMRASLENLTEQLACGPA
jgi:hypothetical protein